MAMKTKTMLVELRKEDYTTTLAHYASQTASKLAHQMSKISNNTLEQIEQVWQIEDQNRESYRASIRANWEN